MDLQVQCECQASIKVYCKAARCITFNAHGSPSAMWMSSKYKGIL